MERSCGEHMGLEAIPTQSSQFHNDRNLVFKAACLSKLGHHQFASRDVILDCYPLPLFTVIQFCPGNARGLTTLGFLRAGAN